MKSSIWEKTKNPCNQVLHQIFEKGYTGQAVHLPGERSGMEPVVMTPEELAEYLNNMPENMILRVAVQEDSDEPEDDRQV